jgi:acetate kinase
VRVLVVNAGSSSLKLTLLDADDTVLAQRSVDAPRADVEPTVLRAALRDGRLDRAEVVGHRIVHGGTRFRDAVAVNAGVETALRDLCDLAPLHQTKSLVALDAVTTALPDRPAVACFDTAFHATIPDAATTYALPEAWRTRWDLRRFGFHGLSHAWVARTVAAPRVVSCHLGAGASLCAIRDGASVDTTMGFTPLEGLVMATRSGSVDPGLLLWLLGQGGLSDGELAGALEHESGLLGLAGTADMREVLDRAHAGDDRAILGRDTYVHRLRAGVAAMAATLGGMDALVFTGGVGEHAPEIRARTADGLAFLGVTLDAGRNAAATGDADIGGIAATVDTRVLTAREDLEIARQTRDLLASRR